MERRRIVSDTQRANTVGDLSQTLSSLVRFVVRYVVGVFALSGFDPMGVTGPSILSLRTLGLYGGRKLSAIDQTSISHSVGLLPVVPMLSQSG